MSKKKKPLVKYTLSEFSVVDGASLRIFQPADPSWFEWLTNQDGFIYNSENGHFTARREKRKGIEYWYAYRRREGRLHKIYLGKSLNLSHINLEQASIYLAGRISLDKLLSKDHITNNPYEIDSKLSLVSSNYKQVSSIETAPLTKLMAPVLLQNHIFRPQLISRLTTPLAVLCAPSGYGKTTLLNEWRIHNDLQIAWVTLDAEDNNPQRFWLMVVSAFQSIHPDVGQSWLSLLYTASSTDISKIVIYLINDIARLFQNSGSEYFIGFVLDNYHYIHNLVIHSSLQIFLENIPPNIKMVIASQTNPPLDMGSLRSKGSVIELSVDDLRFSLVEGIEFLSQHDPIKKLSYEDIQKLVNRTNGWITGLVLAVNLFSQDNDSLRFLESFNGSHPYIREFFNQNILKHLPGDVQTFLLQTSILKQLNGQLCDALTDRNDSTELLEKLWVDRLFIRHIEELNVFRYDELFLESLRAELSEKFPAEINNLHRKAAGWYENNQFPADTIHHFLKCEAWSEAVELIKKIALTELEKSGEGARLLRWLQQIPAEILYQHGTLLFLFIRLAMHLLPPPEVERILTRVQIYFGSSRLANTSQDSQRTLVKINQLHRLWITRDKPISDIDLIETGYSMYQMLDDILIFKHDYFRDLIHAEELASSVYERALNGGNLFAILLAGNACANLAFSQGQFKRSEIIAHQVLQQALKIYGKLPEAASNSLTILSGIFHERNQNDQAHQLLIRAVEINPQPTNSDEPVMIAILRAKIQSAEGENEAAVATIQSIRELNNHYPSSIWADKDLASYQALFRLQQGDLASAERLLDEPGKNDLHGFSSLARAAILMEQKRNVAAEEVLRKLLNTYPHGFFWLPILRVRVMLAIALYEQNKVNQACQVMSEAARLAAPEYFIRPFLVSGIRIVSLLSLVLHTENLNEGTRTFLKGILTMLGYSDGISDIIPREELYGLEVATSITPREQEVLRLLIANLSNLEIANQCSISASTVKTHLENIYRKLGVNSRAQAIAQARLLNLV